MNNKITIRVQQRTKALNDLYGIFFEDLNHAADGGLYAELIQNRSFEFCTLDNKDYHALTAWESVGKGAITIETTDSVHKNNPHYAHIVLEGRGGIRNSGFNTGIPLKAGEDYRFSCYVRGEMTGALSVCLENAQGIPYTCRTLEAPSDQWQKLEIALTAPVTDFSSRLSIVAEGNGWFDVDHVSLFPVDTFMGRPNGMRRDIAELLANMKPRFMRFPGGCLVHCGSLDENARDSMYRWKNTIGPLEARAARASNWNCNQTLGLGFYEYFQFCEDIGAKPLPVIPAGYNPHAKQAVPLDEMQPWIDDALDLIEFANGDASTIWGGKRAELGHPEPFGLEYLGIGNEEVGQDFFDRYALFHKAIREKHPKIKLINTSGPNCAGGEYERGWSSARKHGSDYVDEHYYQTPQWFLANIHRYDKLDPNGPKVFLGEYASWGNTWYNALAEAAFMTGLERAPAVGLACYAPMLANVDYVNWRPDMIWFDNHQAFGSANYHVQRLFMENQGDFELDCHMEHEAPITAPEIMPIQGLVSLETHNATIRFTDIEIIDLESGVSLNFPVCEISPDCLMQKLAPVKSSRYKITVTAQVLEQNMDMSVWGNRGLRICIRESKGNEVYWELGGWQNQDATICSVIDDRNSCLTQSLFELIKGSTYKLELLVEGRTVSGYVDGELLQQAEDTVPIIQPLYTTASKDSITGDIIIKAVNITDEDKAFELVLDGLGEGERQCRITRLTGFPLEAENTFDNPDAVSPQSQSITIMGSRFSYRFPSYSATVLRIPNNN